MNRFEPPSLKERSQVAQAMSKVQEHRPSHGEANGKITCTRCGASLHFSIQSTGLSRGRCAAACGVSWCH